MHQPRGLHNCLSFWLPTAAPCNAGTGSCCALPTSTASLLAQQHTCTDKCLDEEQDDGSIMLCRICLCHILSLRLQSSIRFRMLVKVGTSRSVSLLNSYRLFWRIMIIALLSICCLIVYSQTMHNVWDSKSITSRS